MALENGWIQVQPYPLISYSKTMSIIQPLVAQSVLLGLVKELFLLKTFMKILILKMDLITREFECASAK